MFFFFSSRRRHTRCALVTGVQTCALPISLPSGLVSSFSLATVSPLYIGRARLVSARASHRWVWYYLVVPSAFQAGGIIPALPIALALRMISFRTRTYSDLPPATEPDAEMAFLRSDSLLIRNEPPGVVPPLPGVVATTTQSEQRQV